MFQSSHLASGIFRLACIVLLVSGGIAASDAKKPTTATAGKVREYFIAAEEVVWNFAPGGRDLM